MDMNVSSTGLFMNKTVPLRHYSFRNIRVCGYDLNTVIFPLPQTYTDALLPLTRPSHTGGGGGSVLPWALSSWHFFLPWISCHFSSVPSSSFPSRFRSSITSSMLLQLYRSSEKAVRISFLSILIGICAFHRESSRAKTDCILHVSVTLIAYQVLHYKRLPTIYGIEYLLDAMPRF